MSLWTCLVFFCDLFVLDFDLSMDLVGLDLGLPGLYLGMFVLPSDLTWNLLILTWELFFDLAMELLVLT